MVMIMAGLVDMLISGVILLIYFGLLPIDISNWGLPRWIIGLGAGVWFLASLALVAYQVTKPTPPE